MCQEHGGRDQHFPAIKLTQYPLTHHFRYTDMNFEHTFGWCSIYLIKKKKNESLQLHLEVRGKKYELVDLPLEWRWVPCIRHEDALFPRHATVTTTPLSPLPASLWCRSSLLPTPHPPPFTPHIHAPVLLPIPSRYSIKCKILLLCFHNPNFRPFSCPLHIFTVRSQN